MRHAMLGLLLVILAAFPADARFKPGMVFQAVMQRDDTGESGTMTITTNRFCAQGGITFYFECTARWQCEGAACPGRQGRLVFTFKPNGLDEIRLRVSRHEVCDAGFVGSASCVQTVPFHWRYACFSVDPSAKVDSGTMDVSLKPAS